MRNLLIILLISTGTLFHFSCGIGFDCELRDAFPTFDELVSVDSLMNAGIVATQESFDSAYFKMEVVIQSDSAYEALKTRSDNANCTNCNFPDIDFSQKTVVGWLLDQGCKGVGVIKVIKDSDLDYRFIIKFIDNSQCSFESCEIIDFVWVTMDKLPENANITFIETESYYDCEC